MLLFIQKKNQRDTRTFFVNFCTMFSHLELLTRSYYGSYELGIINDNREIVFFRTHNEESLYVYADESTSLPTFAGTTVTDLNHLVKTYSSLLENQVIEEIWVGYRIPFTNIGSKNIALYFIKEENSVGGVLYHETESIGRKVLTMVQIEAPNWIQEGF